MKVYYTHEGDSKLEGYAEYHMFTGKNVYGDYYCIFYSVKELKESVNGKFENKENN